MKNVLLLVLTITLIFGACKETPKDQNQQIIKVLRLRQPNKCPIYCPQTPHDITSFTEGLFFENGKLFEGTGSPQELSQTRSIAGPVDIKTGKIDVKVELDRTKFFGEGVCILNGKLYQLTYKNQLAFIYDATTFKSLGTFKYANAEGWGLTTDGKELIMSDGTDKLTFINPDNYNKTKELSIKANGNPVYYLNELEYVNGYIFANI
ncbi:MAG: glutaminyl-peptide cyclotransferase [Saprospiraceae bacterium]|nr:glutaminyl-peptide cyclotransferase [Saprospiraceae bacterium]